MMDEAGFDTAHVAGNSLGGWLAMELAKRGRARSVTALAPAGGWGRWDFRHTMPVLGKFLGMAPLVMVGGVAGKVAGRIPLAHRVMLSIVSSDWRKVDAQDSLNMLRASTHCRGYFYVLLNGVLHGGVRDLDMVDVPVRLVLCEHDRVIPPKAFASRFQDELPDVHTIMLEGIGHVPMLEAPELVADTIADHVHNCALPVAM
jgi:pimeloyl-ACP methyl ester carboxylesterase